MKTTLYKMKLQDKEVCRFTVNKDIDYEAGSIQIFDKENTPILVILAEERQNNIKGIKCVLEKRVVPPNRMFLDDYCRERGLDPNNLDDRLKLSHGRVYTDDCYIEVETYINGNLQSKF